MSIIILQDFKDALFYIRSRIERGDDMSAIIQYDLFAPKPTEVEVCQIEIAAVKKSSDKVRRGTYASIGELKKRCYELEGEVKKNRSELEYRLEILERNICHGK
jgi:hypothetical protein